MPTHDSPTTSDATNNECDAQRTPKNTTWWPPLKEALLSGELKPEDLEVQCPICLERCTVLDHEYELLGYQHAASIYACGHIFGNMCMRKRLYHVIVEREEVTCPLCLECLQHPQCGHPNLGHIIPLEKERTSSVPEILSRGGTLEPNCQFCWLADLAKKLKRKLCSLHDGDFDDRIKVKVKVNI
ncbi:hypothetical protein FPOA_07112 [Fusarium poae]|uniref:RING-type domain-containing protein n=2 Tax=Fusarium poae TaxID=36050 RepID=A0A1B8AJM1_FUSPO|nr:hypothetical protein FPOA_07112 [Fusarium poae]